MKSALNIRPLTGNIGAEIAGVRASQLLDDDVITDLRDALAVHHVIFLCDLNADLTTQKALTEKFGNRMKLPYVAPLDGEPDVIRVYKNADDTGGVFGGDWHTDFSFLETPPAGSILSAVTVPPFGGDTIWSSQAAAWDALPGTLQDLLRERDAIHVGKPYGVKWAPPAGERSGGGTDGMRMSRGDPTADEERRHPAALRHPETGRLALFLNPTYVARLSGLTEEQSRPLLDQIQRHATRPEFCCRFRWTPGTLAIWDNLFTQHYAVNDYAGHERLMYRTTFAGARPADLAASPRKALREAAE